MTPTAASSSSSSSGAPTLLTPSSSKDEFDIISSYHTLLSSDAELPFPIAAIFALSELVSKSKAATTSELMENIRSASHRLKSSLENPVPATAGLDLFTRFVVTKSWDTGDDFEAHKASLAALAHEFATHTVPSCREKICELVLPFIKDDSVILTHSYSRVVMQALKHAALHQRKRISVYVTESRPNGLGLKTYNQLIGLGIPCTVILDSAVAYTMPKVDLVLTGAEGVVESGGFLNAVGTYGMAIIAKTCGKPFFCARGELQVFANVSVEPVRSAIQRQPGTGVSRPTSRRPPTHAKDRHRHEGKTHVEDARVGKSCGKFTKRLVQLQNKADSFGITLCALLKRSTIRRRTW